MLADLETAVNVAQKIDDGNPVRFVQRVAGLGQAEQQAGIPKWAWATMGLIAGALIWRQWGSALERRVRGRRAAA